MAKPRKPRIVYTEITPTQFVHELSKRQRRAFAHRATYDKEVAKNYRYITNKIKAQVNKTIRELKKNKLAYGPEVRAVENYSKSQGKKILQYTKYFKNNIYEMEGQNEVAIKFLHSGKRSLTSAKIQQHYRLERLKELNAISQDFAPQSRQSDEDFLRFLGDEVVSATLEGFANSEVIVEMWFDAYQKEGKRALNIMKKAFLEFKAHKIGFNEAMMRVGVRVEDYPRFMS